MARKPKKQAAKAADETATEPSSGAPSLMGRPSKYDPSWCERVIAYGSEGMSRAEISLELKIGRRSLYRYIDQHPEFAEAMEEADWLAKAWWERLGRKGVERGIKDNWSPPTYQFVMRNRFRDSYSDTQKQEVELGTGFLKFLDAARKGEFKTPAPAYPKAPE